MLSLIDRLRLRGKLKSPDIGTRSKAVDFLAKNTSDPSAVKLLLMVRKKEGGNGVGYTALKAIESVKCAGAVDALLAALRDGDDGLRCGAAKALGNIRDPRSVEGLCAALKDDDGQIRWAASVALGNIGDPRAASALIEVLSTSHKMIVETHKDILIGWCNTALGASKALGQIGDKRATDVLVATLRKVGDFKIKSNAATALGQLKDPGAAEVLAEVLGDRKNFSGNSHGITWEVQADAVIALGGIGGPRAIEALVAAIENTTLPEAVRRTAEEALSRAGGATAKPALAAGQKKPYLMTGREMASYLHQNILPAMFDEIKHACQKDGRTYCSGMATEGPTEPHAIVLDHLVLAVEFSPGADWKPQQEAMQSIMNRYLAEPGWRLVAAYPDEQPSRSGGRWVKFSIERK